MKSKRAALRFKCTGEKVCYKTAFEDGEGVLLDISTQGCALEAMTLSVEEGEVILLSAKLPGEEHPVEMQAKVMRSGMDTAAVKFTLAEKETEATIRTYFSQKMRNSKKA